MIVKILDTNSGISKWINKSFSFSWWSTGNGSCDCNRSLFHSNIDNGDLCLGCVRFLIIDYKLEVGEILHKENKITNLEELNDQYSEDMIKLAKKHFIRKQKLQKLNENQK